MKPLIQVLNTTCLDVMTHNAEFLREYEGLAQIVVNPNVRTMDEKQLDNFITDADAIIINAGVVGFPCAEIMRRRKALKVLSLACSGYDWLDLDAATRCGIIVTNAPVPTGAEVVADHTLGLMLAASRQIPHHHAVLAKGEQERGFGRCLWQKTLGIIGLGRIGLAVARRAAAFDMRINATSPSVDEPHARKLGITTMPLQQLLEQSDFVSLHVRLNNRTRYMIGAVELARMKPTAYLVNCARRDLVDEQALFDALRKGRIAGAAVDDPPHDHNAAPFDLPTFIATNHLGNRAIEGMVAVFRQAIENVIDVVSGHPSIYVVNPEVIDAPKCRLGRHAGRPLF